MLYNDLTSEQKKAINQLLIIGSLLLLLLTGFLIKVVSGEHKIEKITQKYFKSAKVKTYNKDYLIIRASEYMTEEERLIGLRNTLQELKALKLKNAIVVVQFYDNKWETITKQMSVGMSTVYNTDWTEKITFKEFEKLINYKTAP